MKTACLFSIVLLMVYGIVGCQPGDTSAPAPDRTSKHKESEQNGSVRFVFEPKIGTQLDCKLKVINGSGSAAQLEIEADYRLEVKSSKDKNLLLERRVTRITETTSGIKAGTMSECLITPHGLPTQFFIADNVWGGEEFMMMPLPNSDLSQGKSVTFESTIELVKLNAKTTFQGYKKWNDQMLPELKTEFRYTSSKPDQYPSSKGVAVYLYDPQLKCVVKSESDFTVVPEKGDPTVEKPTRWLFEAKAVKAGKG